jgi:hypothetical protein
MDEQVSEPGCDIDRNLRTLIRGLTQDNRAEIYNAYKALFKIGAPAIPQIRASVLKSNWPNLKYPNENRYVSGLVNLIHDIDESEARTVANQLKNKGCDLAVARFLDSICAFTLADYAQYEVCGVKVFEHKKLVTKQKVKVRLEQWLKNIPIEDLNEIDRIYIVRSQDMTPLGTYRPILYVINLVWDNPSSRWSPVSWLNNYVMQIVLYHEIGHHVHRHTFGEDPDQEREADKYVGRIFANIHPLVFRIVRWFAVAWRWSIRALMIRALLDSKRRRRRHERR